MPRSAHHVALIALALAPWLTTACGPAGPSGMGADMNADLLAAAVRTHISAASLEPHARAIGARAPVGSAGENAAIDYVVETLEAAGVPVEVHAFEVYVPTRCRLPSRCRRARSQRHHLLVLRFGSLARAPPSTWDRLPTCPP